MVLLHISADLQARLERIDSPIAKAILAMSTIDDTRKDYINYLGISRDDVTKISYLDRNKEKKNSIKHPKNFRYHSNNGDSTVSINKRFFRKIFWRGRWIKNPHFVDVNLRPHMTCKERRSWYKKKFSFVHSIYDYGEQFYKNRSYLQLLRKDEHNQRYYLGDMKVDTMKWQQSYIRSQYRYECEYKNTEDWGSVYMYKSMLKNSPLKFHWNTFTEWHDRLWNPDHRLHGSADRKSVV